MKPPMIALCLLLLPFASSTAEEPAAPDLTVAIAAPEHHGVREVAAAGFRVVVTNVSSGPVRVFREWCSWGYFQLSFEVRDEDGKVLAVARKPRDWDKNYPDYWTLAPGDPLVLDVALAPDGWSSGLFSSPLAGRVLEMRAVFAAEEDEESKREGVWSGRVVSPWRSYRIS